MNDDNWQQKILQLHCHPVIIYHGKRCEIDAREMTNDQSYSINPEIDIVIEIFWDLVMVSC